MNKNTLDAVRTPSAWKTALYEKTAAAPKRRLRPPMAIAAALCVLLLLSGSAVAYGSLSDAGRLQAWFSDRVKDEAPSYMNVEQLEAIAGSTLGVVAEDSRLRIEVTSCVADGNACMVCLRVTAKRLDTVLRDNGIPTMPHYRFDSSEGSLLSSMSGYTAQYVYADRNPALAPNQLEIIYTILNKEDFRAGDYTLSLRSFGYMHTGQKHVTMKTVYKGPWSFTLSLPDGGAYSRSLPLREPLAADGFAFCLESATLTPVSASLIFSAAPTDGTTAQEENRLRALSAIVDTLTLTLTDGSALTAADAFTPILQSRDENVYVAELLFTVPILAADITAVNVDGQTVELPR